MATIFSPELADWLTKNGFQVMLLKATRPWPGDPEFFVEVSKSRARNSPIWLLKLRANAPRPAGYGFKLNGGIDLDGFTVAFDHFLARNQAAKADFLGEEEWPPVKHMGGRAPEPIVREPKR